MSATTPSGFNGSALKQQIVPELRTVASSVQEAGRVDDIGAYYPDVDETIPEIPVGLVLLSEAHGHAKEALRYSRDGDKLEADDAANRIQRCMERLMLIPTISVGLDSVIVAIHAACKNRGSALVSELQAQRISEALRQAALEPFLSLDSAIALVSRIDDAGLSVTMPCLIELAQATLDE